jgi:hypothetical protein
VRRALRNTGLTVVVIAATAGGLVLLSRRAPSSAAPPTTTEPQAGEIVAVERRDLVRQETVAGTLTYGARTELKGTGGTITALPADGTVIGRGTPLWEEDGRAGPILLIGARPLWRPLSTASDDGPDIRQLEENLVAMGLADPARLTVDDEFTSETARAVKRWQESLGREQTGRVELGDAIFQPGPVRVADSAKVVGDASDGAVLEVTGTARRVHVDLDAADAALAAAGAAVTVELPDGTTVDGTIAAVGSTAEVADNGNGTTSTTIDVEIDLASDVKALDESPVEVALESSRVTGALAVPVQALLSLAEGGYALERRLTDGTTELVAVSIGAFADGWVEVKGEIAPGDEVVSP